MNIDEIKGKIKNEITYCDNKLDYYANSEERSYYEGKSIGLGYALNLIQKLQTK